MKNDQLIQETAEELLKNLKVQAKVLVKEEADAFQVQIETEESGLLIGYHGETLEALQLILSLILYKKTGNWVSLVVDVGDWLSRRQELLRQMALEAAAKVVSSGEAVVLPALSSFERRLVHLALADHAQVTTVSEGEGRERKLVIKPK